MCAMTSKLRSAACLAALLALSASSASAAPEDSQTNVVGGQETTIEEWPWQVAIAHPPADGGDGYERQFCGGALVAPALVLTAAHCAYGEEAFEPPSEFSVISGRTTLSSDQGTEQPATDVFYFVDDGNGPEPRSTTLPPSDAQLYDPSTTEWDVVLIELASAAPSPASPIRIAGASERDLWEPGDAAYITGWGDTTGAQTYADDLHAAQVEIIDDDDCSNSYATPFAMFEAETMVCAGDYPLGGEDTCQGDSGGPLVVPAGDGTYRLVGDTSWGIGCALPTLPGIYGRIADAPMRPALEQAIAQAGGTSSSPTEPSGPGATEQTPTGGSEQAPSGEAAGSDTSACDAARERLAKARRKLSRARKALARAETPKQEQAAKRKLAAAKERKKQAAQLLAAECRRAAQ